jgi:hypothetical protein
VQWIVQYLLSSLDILFNFKKAAHILYKIINSRTYTRAIIVLPLRRCVILEGIIPTQGEVGEGPNGPVLKGMERTGSQSMGDVLGCVGEQQERKIQALHWGKPKQARRSARQQPTRSDRANRNSLNATFACRTCRRTKRLFAHIV